MQFCYLLRKEERKKTFHSEGDIMSSWKSIVAGRENDVYFLLKELVEDREIAKAIGDFKGLSGPKKEGEDEQEVEAEARY